MSRIVVVASAIFAGLLALGFWALGRGRRRRNRAEYRVVDRKRGWELREYPPLVEARVTVEGDYDRAVREGFRVLAAYLGGANACGDEVGPDDVGTRMAMTAPVSVTEGPEGWTVAFAMPSDLPFDDLPRPIDPRIALVEVPGRQVAARRFSGAPRRASIDRQTRRLHQALDRFGMIPHDAVVVAHYDPPAVPWFLRRNEVLVAVA